MTVHAVLIDPPRPGRVLDELTAAGPLTEAEAAELYGAMARDTLRAVEASGGDLLVNYHPDASDGDDASGEIRAIVDEALDDPDAARLEVQVGSTFAARAGNTATHLLREEDAESVAILRPTTPTLTRVVLDGAAMQLRRHETVIGPAHGGRVFYLGVTAPFDFEGAYDPPAQVSLVERAVEAGHDIAFLGMQPVVETPTELSSLMATLAARQRGGLAVPQFTQSLIDRLGLESDGSRVRRTDSA